MSEETNDYYSPLRERIPPLELDAVIPNRITFAKHRVHGSFEHLRYHEHAGLDDLLIGEVQPIADPTGKARLTISRRKLARVLRGVSNLNPAIYPGGAITDEKELHAWIEAEENADAVWALWIVYERAIENPRLKSTSQDSGDRSGADEGSSQETAAAARVSAVPGVRANGESGGSAVSGADSAGAVS